MAGHGGTRSNTAGSGLSRRSFFRLTAAGALALYMVDGRSVRMVHAAAIPGGTLDPTTVEQFTMPLLLPGVMPKTGHETYSIALRQVSQQMLPSGGKTTVWAYGSRWDDWTFTAPSPTIEARRDRKTTVTWRNELRDKNRRYLPHILPVDPTLHWANPGGGYDGIDTTPTFEETPGPYTGPVPMVVHVHGMQNVPDWADGYPEAWYLPEADDIPDGYASRGTWYKHFRSRAMAAGLPKWPYGTMMARYPNDDRPSTMWFHDHTLGMTRLNVYAGPTGFYILRSSRKEDNPTTSSGKRAVLPGDDKPGSPFELQLAIQDRSFNANNSLFYPDTREFFDEFAGPFIPETDVPPIWNPEFFGNTIIVNGRAWPFHEVEPRRYRLRLLNGCGSRFLILKFSNPGVTMWQIGNEGGYLSAAVEQDQLLLAPAERADVIVDFSAVKGGSVELLNVGPDSPFGGPVAPEDQADSATTGRVMRFDVTLPLSSTDRSTPPKDLVMPRYEDHEDGSVRRLTLFEMMSMEHGIPVMGMLGTWDPTPTTGGPQPKTWADTVTENPAVDSYETWEVYNPTMDAHPVHVHEVAFQVVNRQEYDPATNQPTGPIFDPEPSETGFKDTVIAYPGQVTRIRMHFSEEGRYVWHCHILEHEDNEMMRPLQVGKPQHGQPKGRATTS